ncbi:MAG: oxidoreductase [Deltaproteobacteria bacterium]|nr:oxidoreductase [Deltaproteobacteria bacterium]
MKKIAVIGAGYWGKNLVRNYYDLGALKTVCDNSPQILKNIQTTYSDIEVTTRYEEILRDKEIKGVVIALPAEMHYDYAAKALRHGKDVFVEKPLALKVDQAAELCDIADKEDRILMVGHLLRYHSAFIKLQELIESGELGRIQYIYSNRLSLGKIRREENTLWSFAPHDISMILALCHEMPEHVYAHGANYLHSSLADVTTTHLSFSSGINSHIFVSWLHPFKEQKLVVVADKKMAVFEDTQPWDKKITLYPHQISWKGGAPVPQKAEAEYVSVKKSEPLQAECSHFLHCIETRKAPITDGREGLRVLQVLAVAQASLEDRSLQPAVAPAGKTASEEYFVHPSAYVDEPCEIGKGTKIWHFSHILKNARIGANCIIGQNVNIANDVSIGNNVKIQNNVSVYTGTIVEDDVFLGPSCVLTNVKNPRSQVNRHALYEKTLFKRGATIGANATIVCGTTIGRYAFIAAGAVVTGDVPDYAMMAGVPARRIGWVSRHCVKLPVPDKKGIMGCPESGLRYIFKKPDIVRCIDLDEEAPLPEPMRHGERPYDSFKAKKPRKTPVTTKIMKGRKIRK